MEKRDLRVYCYRKRGAAYTSGRVENAPPGILKGYKTAASEKVTATGARKRSNWVRAESLPTRKLTRHAVYGALYSIDAGQ